MNFFLAEFPFQTVLMKPLLVQGFQSYHTIVKWPEAEKQMAVWIKEVNLLRIVIACTCITSTYTCDY